MESKEVRGLMEAYASVYNQDLNETMMPTQLPSKDPIKMQKPQPQGRPIVRGPIGRGPLGKPGIKGDSGPVIKSMGEQSVFDIVKGHLLDEGYADTEQAALAIMANMSEEWKQSIVEGVGGYDDPILGPDTPGGKLVRSGIGAVKKVVTGVVKGVGSEFAKPAPQQPLRPLTQKEKESYKTIK